mgnify:CR=1 FL=1
MELKKETALVETILFLESEPVTEKSISTISQLSIEVVQKCIENLKEKYNDEATGIELAMITGGWTLVPKTVYWEQLKERYGEKNSGKLSKSAIETLSIIAYSQPVTRGEIESIRGVSADNMIRLLLDRNLIKEVDSVTAELQSANETNNNLQAKYDEDIAKAVATINQLKETVQSLTNDLNNKNNELTALSERYNALNTTCENFTVTAEQQLKTTKQIQELTNNLISNFNIFG